MTNNIRLKVCFFYLFFKMIKISIKINKFNNVIIVERSSKVHKIIYIVAFYVKKILIVTMKYISL